MLSFECFKSFFPVSIFSHCNRHSDTLSLFQSNEVKYEQTNELLSNEVRSNYCKRVGFLCKFFA